MRNGDARKLRSQPFHQVGHARLFGNLVPRQDEGARSTGGDGIAGVLAHLPFTDLTADKRVYIGLSEQIDVPFSGSALS